MRTIKVKNWSKNHTNRNIIIKPTHCFITRIRNDDGILATEDTFKISLSFIGSKNDKYEGQELTIEIEDFCNFFECIRELRDLKKDTVKTLSINR